MKIYSFSAIRYSKDFYSALVRFSLGLFIALYVWVGLSNGDFNLSREEYNHFASFYFIITTIMALDLFRNPQSSVRRYVTLVFDFTCTTYAISLTGGGSSEFILIYLWLYIAYGTRYGAPYLTTAVVLVVLGYNYILIVDNTWSNNPLTSCAQLFVLIAMPFYLHSMLKQLREAKFAAEQATRVKSSFLAMMSHEIRTPMSGIIGTAHLLQKTRLDSKQKEYTTALLDASKSLHALIDDILDFSKIEANKLQLQNIPFDLRQTINEVVAVLSSEAEQHSLEFVSYIAPHLPSFVIGDSQRLRQILFNLIGNAIKFTEQGEVIIKVTAIEPSAAFNHKPSVAFNKESSAVLEEPATISLCFDIIDTGIGITDEQKDKIFTSFTQADDLQSHKFGGTGLGTTIAKQLVEIMGGEIGLNNTLKSGSHFWFKLTLPVEKNGNIKERYYHTFKHRRIAVSIANDALYQVLEYYCDFLGFSVQRYALEAEIIHGIQQAVTDNKPYDVLLLSSKRDAAMPENMIRKINQLDYGSHPAAKILCLDYMSKETDKLLANTPGFDACITKPVDFERLGDVLLALLEPSKESIEKAQCCDLDNVSLTILIAEDEDINAMVLSSFLQNDGHKCKRVSNGVDAVEELSKHDYDMVFMDMRMPEMNGLEAAKKWRRLEKEQHIPIVALTANATLDDRQACLDSGMDDFISKPVTPEQLVSAISKLFRSRS